MAPGPRGAGAEEAVLRTGSAGAEPPAVLLFMARGRTRCVRCAHYARTGARKLERMRAARAAMKTPLLGASNAPAPRGPGAIVGQAR